MIKPADILLYTGTGLLIYYLIRGVRQDTRRSAEREEVRREKQKTQEVQRTAQEFMLSWKDSRGRRQSVNLDTLSLKLKEALRGSIFNEDEAAIKMVMTTVPVSIKGPSGISYPIRTIAARYAINTNGKNLKADLIRLLSRNELQSTGTNRHIQFL